MPPTHLLPTKLQQALAKANPKDQSALPPNIQAAILLPIILYPDQPKLLFTERSQQLKHHPGQICFPGGKQEANDTSLMATALRETHEEIGVPPIAFELMGKLPSTLSNTGFWVTPFVATAQAPLALKLASHEVAETFEVPLAWFLQAEHYQLKHVEYQQRWISYYECHYQQKKIWGLTANVLYSLYQAWHLA